MTLRSLPLQWNIPHVDASARSARPLGDADVKQLVTSLEKTSLWGVMATAVQALHDRADRNMTSALAHVQSVLKLPSAQDVGLALDTVKQVSLQVQQGKSIAKGLDLLEGFGAVGLHKHQTFAAALGELASSLAAQVHRDDLKFVMEVAAEIPGAHVGMDRVGKARMPELLKVLGEAESPRSAIERGDQDRVLELMQKNRTINFEQLIHDAALWGDWLDTTKGASGNGHPLTSAAQRAHQEMFPAYRYPHSGERSAVDVMMDDGFVRGR